MGVLSAIIDKFYHNNEKRLGMSTLFGSWIAKIHHSIITRMRCIRQACHCSTPIF